MSEYRGQMVLVEDSLHVRNVVKLLFEENGFEVFGFSDGQEALKFFQSENTDNVRALVTDVVMPQMGGLELLENLKKTEKLKNLSVVIVTATASRENILAAKSMGVSNYVLKPLTSNKIMDLLYKMFPEEQFKKVGA